MSEWHPWSYVVEKQRVLLRVRDVTAVNPRRQRLEDLRAEGLCTYSGPKTKQKNIRNRWKHAFQSCLLNLNLNLYLASVSRARSAWSPRTHALLSLSVNETHRPDSCGWAHLYPTLPQIIWTQRHARLCGAQTDTDGQRRARAHRLHTRILYFPLNSQSHDICHKNTTYFPQQWLSVQEETWCRASTCTRRHAEQKRTSALPV